MAEPVQPPPFLVIVGPTGGGKTRLAIELARAVPSSLGSGGECISADSMQVYRGMDIGTAKPTAAERGDVPHHLLDLVEPSDETFTVERWLDTAESTIREVRGRGRVPIVVGGTNLYVRALLEGLFEGPAPDPELRAALEALPLEELRSELARHDPESATRIHANDRRRTVRAVEVFRQTGAPLSALQTQWSADFSGNVRPDALVIGLDWPVETINRRINARVKGMIEAGFLEEVRRLRERGRLGRQARDAVGYGELLEHLEGRLTLDEAVERIKIRTRRYGKQQRTWLRRLRRLPRSVWIDAAVLPADAWCATVVEALARPR